MAVQIDELDMQVDASPAAAGAPAANAPPLPSALEAWRAQWLAERRAEQWARWSAFDRDDER
jgi:hypothetical protein